MCTCSEILCITLRKPFAKLSRLVHLIHFFSYRQATLVTLRYLVQLYLHFDLLLIVALPLLVQIVWVLPVSTKLRTTEIHLWLIYHALLTQAKHSLPVVAR